MKLNQVVLVGAFFFACACSSSMKLSALFSDEASKQIPPDVLRKSILNDNYGIVALCKRVGPDGFRVLQELAYHPDADVRDLTMNCMIELEIPAAIPIFVDALADKDRRVRMSAINGLNSLQLGNEWAEPLLVRFDESKDPEIRKEIPIIMGAIESIDKNSELAKRLKIEMNPKVKLALMVVLAKLGDTKARAGFRKFWTDSRSEQNPVLRREFFEYCEYIHQRWLLRSLGEMLGDQTEILFLGETGRGKEARPRMLRACDWAIQIIASISGKRFSFEIQRPIDQANYSAEEIQEVLRYVEKQPV